MATKINKAPRNEAPTDKEVDLLVEQKPVEASAPVAVPSVGIVIIDY